MIKVQALAFGLLISSASLALAANGEVKGFRFITCEQKKCILVEAPTAWLSQANGSFVAESASVKLTNDGRVEHEFRGGEVVSQPLIDSLTIETERAVVLVGIKSYSVETMDKRGQR